MYVREVLTNACAGGAQTGGQSPPLVEPVGDGDDRSDVDDSQSEARDEAEGEVEERQGVEEGRGGEPRGRQTPPDHCHRPAAVPATPAKTPAGTIIPNTEFQRIHMTGNKEGNNKKGNIEGNIPFYFIPLLYTASYFHVNQSKWGLPWLCGVRMVRDSRGPALTNPLYPVKYRFNSTTIIIPS